MSESKVGVVGIIGAGHIGQALAHTALRAGREVVIANSRGPESLAPVVDALGAGVAAGTVAEAAATGIVAIAVPWAKVPAAVGGLRWEGQTVVDATNAWNSDDLDGAPPARSSLTSCLALGWSRPPTRWRPKCLAKILMTPAAVG